MAENPWLDTRTPEEICMILEQRLGQLHARQRLAIEERNEQIFGGGINFFHPENWYSMQSVMRFLLKLTGLYSRGCKNTELVEVHHNQVKLRDFRRVSKDSLCCISATCTLI